MSVGLWIALIGAVALIVAGLLLAAWKLSRRSDTNRMESEPPAQETGATTTQGGGAGLKSSPVIPGHPGPLAERLELTRVQARREWRTRLGFALFGLAVAVLVGAALVGWVMIRAFEQTLPTVPEDSAHEARLVGSAQTR
jgi:hypothetical protein